MIETIFLWSLYDHVHVCVKGYRKNKDKTNKPWVKINLPNIYSFTRYPGKWIPDKQDWIVYIIMKAVYLPPKHSPVMMLPTMKLMYGRVSTGSPSFLSSSAKVDCSASLIRVSKLDPCMYFLWKENKSDKQLNRVDLQQWCNSVCRVTAW